VDGNNRMYGLLVFHKKYISADGSSCRSNEDVYRGRSLRNLVFNKIYRDAQVLIELFVDIS
jgi:hypothetical protein